MHLSFRPEGDKNWFQLDKKQVLNYVQELDISAGILRREMHFIDEQQPLDEVESDIKILI